MNWFYAKDGEQVGPLLEGDLRALFQMGTVSQTDLVWREGTEEWVAAGTVFGAGSELTQLDGSPLPPSAMPPSQNGMALASMILGICSFVLCGGLLTGIAGIICGHVANRQMRESPFPQSGQGMAKSGLIMSYIASVLTVAVVVGYGLLMYFTFKTMKSYVPPSGPPITAPAGTPSGGVSGSPVATEFLPEEGEGQIEETE